MPRTRHLVLALPLLAASCAGVRSVDDHHTAHAESFHIFGLTIPENDHEKAWSMVPAGAEVTSVQSTPLDWTSVAGILNNILGFTETQISWTGGDPQ